MAEIASRGQLRLSFLRWLLVCVPLVLLLGFLSGRSVPVGDESAWYLSLAKPAGTPPGWVFPLAWGLLYLAIGVALTLVADARGADGRGAAMSLFALQFALNLSWTPLFFGAHLIRPAAWVIAAMLLAAVATTVAFRRVRPLAAWLMLPYLVWISFAGVLTWRIGQLNPDAALVRAGGATQVIR